MRIGIWLVLTVITWANVAFAAGTNTNSAPATAKFETASLLDDIRYYSPFASPLTLYFRETETNSALYRDRFGTQTELDWMVRMKRERYGIHDDVARNGARVFGNIFSMAGQHMAEEILPLDYWECRSRTVAGDIFGGFIGRLIKGTIGDPEEAYIAPASGEYNEVGRSYFMSLQKDNGLDYGFQLLRSDPYAQVTMPFGHLGNQRFALDSRAYFDILARREKFSISAMSPLSQRMRLILGAFISPSAIHSTGDIISSGVSGRIECDLGRNSWASFGVSANSKRTLAQAVFTRTF